MNNGVTFVIGLITGLGIGGIVVVIVKNRARAECEEEIQSVKDAYRKAFNMQKEELEKREPFSGKEKEEALKETAHRIEYNKYGKLARDVDVKELGAIVDGSKYEPEPIEGPSEEELELEEDHPPEGGPQAPFVITPEEYAEEPQYAKEDLDYYIVSNTLVDEHDVEVDDVDRLIGYNNLRHMGEYEPGYLWIRSPDVMTDYQIIAVHGSWGGGD